MPGPRSAPSNWTFVVPANGRAQIKAKRESVGEARSRATSLTERNTIGWARWSKLNTQDYIRSDLVKFPARTGSHTPIVSSDPRHSLHIFLTWTPQGAGPHYEINGKISGNVIDGEWYSHILNRGWFHFKAAILNSEQTIDFAQCEDPINVNMNTVKLTKGAAQNQPANPQGPTHIPR
jgi:hypothetical protein